LHQYSLSLYVLADSNEIGTHFIGHNSAPQQVTHVHFYTLPPVYWHLQCRSCEHTLIDKKDGGGGGVGQVYTFCMM